jgi:hypothetical protein
LADSEVSVGVPFRKDRDEPCFAEGDVIGDAGRSTKSPPSSGDELGRSKSASLKTCTVVLSLVTASHLESGEKAMQWMVALSVPLLSYKVVNVTRT